MAYEAQGRLLADLGTQQVNDKFRKREFVLEIQDGQYPQQVKFQLTQDKCDLLNNMQEGSELVVTFDLRGRAYDKNGQTMYFTNLEAWKVQAAGGQAQGGGSYGGQQQQQQAPRANTNPGLQRPQPAAPIASEADNDLPF